VNRRNLVFLATAAGGLLADQLTKAWIVRSLEHGVTEHQIVDGWFSIVHARNPGAAFSMLEGQLPLFLLVTLIAIPILLDLLRRQPPRDRFVPFTLGLVFAGVIGNFVDRVVRGGEVVDFLKVYAGHEPLRSWFISRVGTNVWPIFNVADSLLVVGVTLFLLYWLLEREGEAGAIDDTTSLPTTPS
jgi:signal peptidase II